MKQVQMTLTEKTPLTADVWQLRFAGDTSPITHPGQFVNLELPGRFLRRPISVCDWDEETLTLLVRVAGKGTAELCQAQPEELHIYFPPPTSQRPYRRAAS